MYRPFECRVIAPFQIGSQTYEASFRVANEQEARELTVSDLRAAAQRIVANTGKEALIAQAVEVEILDRSSSTGKRLTELSGLDPLVSPDRQTAGPFILRFAPFVAFTISEE